jgi:hypothetical protein
MSEFHSFHAQFIFIAQMTCYQISDRSLPLELTQILFGPRHLITLKVLLKGSVAQS